MGGSAPIESQSDTMMEDQISKMPDAILGAILSLLTIKEAGRTSVLSNRWTNLWKLSSHLNFDALPQEIRKVHYLRGDEYKEPLRCKYVTWVNQVLRSHELCSLDEFRVKYDLDKSFSDDIDEWVKFMISKRAKRVEIDFAPYVGNGIHAYSLSQECIEFIKSPLNLSNIKCLKSLTLGGLNIDGELIEYLLSKCPHLEFLSITLRELLRLKVAGPSLPLKYLKLSGCDSLEIIELSAPNLVTLSYWGGNEVNFVFGRNPLLSELFVDGLYYVNGLASRLPLFSSLYSQIETLSLTDWFQDHLELPHVSGMKNLKHLMWNIRADVDTSLIGLTKFITAAPCLEKLTLQLRVFFPLDSSPLEEPTVQCHERLKEVEIYGYVGCRYHLELARYLVKSAINLQKMVIDQTCPVVIKTPGRLEKVAKLVAEQAEELKGSLPPRAELIVL